MQRYRYLNINENFFLSAQAKMMKYSSLKLTNHKLDRDVLTKAYQAVAWKHPMLRANIFKDPQGRPYWKEVSNYTPDFEFTETECGLGKPIPEKVLKKNYLEHGIDKSLVNIEVLTWKDEVIFLYDFCHTLFDMRVMNIILKDLLSYYTEFIQGKPYDPNDPRNKPYAFPVSPIFPILGNDFPAEQKTKILEIIESKKEARESYTYKFPRPDTPQTYKHVTLNLDEGSPESYRQLKDTIKANNLSIGSCVYTSALVSLALLAKDYNTNQGKDKISTSALIAMNQTDRIFPELKDKILLNTDCFDFYTTIDYNSTLLETTKQIKEELKKEYKNYGNSFNSLSYCPPGEQPKALPKSDLGLNLLPEIDLPEFLISENEKIEVNGSSFLDFKKYAYEFPNYQLSCKLTKDRILYYTVYDEDNEKPMKELSFYRKRLTEGLSKYANQRISDIKI